MEKLSSAAQTRQIELSINLQPTTYTRQFSENIDGVFFAKHRYFQASESKLQNAIAPSSTKYIIYVDSMKKMSVISSSASDIFLDLGCMSIDQGK
ncbi:hypothetical protein [Nostoc sp. CMAA1605]|uniref:hypothetical protein n=1 Tax=Nostoc sp. CMAA1605 TaxID=2055159 RepID=UPI001F3267F3|nr:hypothetical protein [Nostoc sp. CMAA1605]